jgi:exodeoxyribonuclease VII small subunit
MKESPIQKNPKPDFEGAFKRLEEILEHLNSGTVSLDDSLKLYEEANHLMISCSEKLNAAERKIETLIKDRDGQVSRDQNGNAITEAYTQ